MKFRELKKEELEIFIEGVQDAFQYGYERYFGKCEETIIPREDILSSYNQPTAKAFCMEEDGKIIGGAIVSIDTKTNVHNLEILYVSNDCQSKGVGYKIWSKIEEAFKEAKVWRTCTPYFDERNINFYVNKCKFHIVEFFNKYHPDPNMKEDFIGDAGEGMFEFEKIIMK